MNLYATAVKAKDGWFWTLDSRMFERREEAEEWAAQSWGDTGCETRIMRLEDAR